MASNLDSIKQAYAAWNDTKGGSIAEWGALMADNVHFGTIAPRRGLEFAGEFKSRAEVVTFLGAVLEQWEMEHFSPQTFVDDGTRIAVFGQCAYRNRATAKLAEFRIAHLWEFEGDQIVRMAEIFDTAHAAAAATPD